MLKKSLLLFLFLLFCLVGCATPTEKKRANEVDLWMRNQTKVKVLSTIAMIDQLVREIGGDRVLSLSLVTGQLDPHHYELVKGDREKIDNADIIFHNGLGLECGASLRYALEQAKCTVSIGDYISKEYPDRIIFIEGQVDPHIWMDMELFSFAIDPIVTILSTKDPEGEREYRERGMALRKKMKQMDRYLREKMQKIPKEKRFLVTSHDAFHYFIKKYLAEPKEKNWKKRGFAPEGLSPDSQISTLDIQFVSDFLYEHQLSTVFPESNVSHQALKKVVAICRERGLHVKLSSIPLYGDAMPEEGDREGAYFRMIEHNVDTLCQLLPNP